MPAIVHGPAVSTGEASRGYGVVALAMTECRLRRAYPRLSAVRHRLRPLWDGSKVVNVGDEATLEDQPV